jgi:hypothetical protein
LTIRLEISASLVRRGAECREFDGVDCKTPASQRLANRPFVLRPTFVVDVRRVARRHSNDLLLFC